MEANYVDLIYVGLTTLIPGHDLWADRAVRTADGGEVMNGLYLIAGLITLGLFIYLVLALLKPEWFG